MLKQTLQFTTYIGLICLVTSSVTNAQIVPDSTLPNNSTINIEGTIQRISGGTEAGSNLFHSFREFNVRTGETAYFDNALTINNIITRVTGGQLSNIDGLIRANGTANLFLINPNGILFGSNARLDIGGSFFGSTADRIQLADGSVFSATNPTAPPLLTVNVPIGLQFGVNPGNIVVQSRATNSSGQSIGLQVPPGRTIGLIGGQVTLEGVLTAPGGQIDLGAVAENERVNLSQSATGFNVNYESTRGFQDIQLTNAKVDTSGEGGGDIQFQGRQIVLSGNSAVISNSLGNRDGGAIAIRGTQFRLQDAAYISSIAFAAGAAADIAINATESVGLTGVDSRPELLTQTTSTFSVDPANLRGGIFTLSFGSGDTGDLTINTGNLILGRGASVWASPFQAGNGGALTINAQSVEMTGSSISTFSFGQQGVSGNLTINTGTLLMQDQSRMLSATGFSRGGDLTINATESVEVIGQPVDNLLFLTAITAGTPFGQAGNVTINTRRLTVRDGAIIDASPVGGGRGGTITINATELVELLNKPEVDPNSSTPFIGVSGVGNIAIGAAEQAGDININTRRLVIQGGAEITSSAQLFQTGNTVIRPIADAGTIRINATESVEVSGTSPNSQNLSAITSSTEGTGNAGGIEIQTRQLILRDGGQISVASVGQGSAGTLTVNAKDSVEINGTVAIASSSQSADIGNIIGGSEGGFNPSEITSGNFLPLSSIGLGRFSEGADDNRIATSLSAVSFREGSSGNIILNTRELRIENGGILGVGSFSTGDAGTLRVNARALRLNNRGNITATTISGKGGDIVIQGDDVQLNRNSRITTNAGNTDGGNITINTDTLVALENSDITANAIAGRGGQVIINTQGIFGTQFRNSQTPASDITATSDLGASFSGTVTITTPEVDTNTGLVDLTAEVPDATDQIVVGCAAASGNSFTVIGRGGLPEDPTATVRGQILWQDVRDLTNPTALRNASASTLATDKLAPSPPLTEATSWVRNEQGKIELVATDPKSNSPSLGSRILECTPR